jgi:hypothetical protein
MSSRRALLSYIVGFVDAFASNQKQKVREAKRIILDTLSAGECKNLRTLQKVIRIIDHIFSISEIQLEEPNVRFLIALIDEDSRNRLKADASIYSKTYSAIVEKTKNKKEEDYTPDQIVGRGFYLRYFKDQYNMGFSLALHNYIRTGILNEALLKEEIAPEDSKLDSAGKLCKEFWRGPWRYQKDADIRNFAERIEKYLCEDGKTKPFLLIRLFGAAIQVRSLIDEENESADY